MSVRCWGDYRETGFCLSNINKPGIVWEIAIDEFGIQVLIPKKNDICTK